MPVSLFHPEAETPTRGFSTLSAQRSDRSVRLEGLSVRPRRQGQYRPAAWPCGARFGVLLVVSRHGGGRGSGGLGGCGLGGCGVDGCGVDGDASWGREQRGEEQGQGPATHAATVPHKPRRAPLTGPLRPSDG